ncbi:MAG: OmpA family protein [Proteobacteria bacterium]|nr:OmpA family protein [Pseudomonadota bacterium]
MDDGVAPIIVKRVTKGGGGHHGGAWKVAYADFVTAMMAFFLLLWLLNVTTDEQKSGLADYFAPTSVSAARSGAGDILAGRTMAPDGARVGEGAPPMVIVDIQPPPPPPQNEANQTRDAELEKLLAEREQAAFDQAKQELEAALDQNPEIAALRENIVIDMTPDGMRIQLVDKRGGYLFPSGSATMPARTRQLIQQIAKVMATLPNDISISGHTDAAQFNGGNGYTNWELSSDRANASRRALAEAGIPIDRISEVVGKADTEPLTPDPFEPENRRISFVLQRTAPVLPPNLR